MLPRCGGDSQQKNPNNDFDFSLSDLDGKMRSMKDFKGEVLIVNFWATWCPPCLEEVHKLNDIYDRYRRRGVQVIGIALDKDSLELVAPFVKENKISYPVLMGNQQAINNLKNFKGVPTTLLFDGEGKIQNRFDGSFEQEQMEESLQSLLED
jgi:cytochrome c biogenesis protein CcmG/thiol:disulfide interchange protein DsbE